MDTYEDLKKHEKIITMSDISQVIYRAILIEMFEIESGLDVGNKKYKFKIKIEEE